MRILEINAPFTRKKVAVSKKIVKKPYSERLMENVQMQGFRNPEE
jgi:hypothetical protein